MPLPSLTREQTARFEFTEEAVAKSAQSRFTKHCGNVHEVGSPNSVGGVRKFGGGFPAPVGGLGKIRSRLSAVSFSFRWLEKDAAAILNACYEALAEGLQRLPRNAVRSKSGKPYPFEPCP
jgi:hypothetical protein